MRSALAWSTPPAERLSSRCARPRIALQQRLGFLAEEREQEQLLLARGEALGAPRGARRGRRGSSSAARRRSSSTARPTRRVDRPGRGAEAALDQVAQLVDDRLVAGRREDVHQRLRGEDLADRRGERRRAGLDADRDRARRAPRRGGRRPRARAAARRARRRGPTGILCSRGAHGDPRRERRRPARRRCARRRGRTPSRARRRRRPCRARARRAPARAASPETRCSVERDRIDRAGDQVRAAPRGLERGGERVPARALAVEADGQAARLAQRARPARCARCGCSEPGGSWSRTRAAPSSGSCAPRRRAPRSRPCGRSRRRGRRRTPPAAGIASAASRRFSTSFSGSWSRKTSMPLSAARGDEAAGEVAADRARADEEAAAERQRERRLRARLQRADALPRALDAAADGRVEDAAARDLEVREAGAVEDLGEPSRSAVGICRRAAPARAGGSSCRRASARAGA